jgi:hypothetical protein
MARLLFRTLESMATPCSVKARTLFEYLMPEDVTVCDIPLEAISKMHLTVDGGVAHL